MGLDLVEMVMAFEEEFGVDIPDSVAGELATPGHVIGYVCQHVPMDENAPCPTQRAFHLLRVSMMRQMGLARSEVVLDGRLAALVPGKDATKQLAALQQELDVRAWPRFESFLVRRSIKRVRDLVPYVATSRQVSLTRAYVARRVEQVVVEQLGLHPSEYSERADFVRDLGAD